MRAKSLINGLLAGAFALFLLYLAVPRAVAAFLSIPGNFVIGQIQGAGEVVPDELRTAIETRLAAARWTGEGRLHTDAALAQMLLGELEGEAGAPDLSLTEQALPMLRDGLSLAPAQPFAWTRLALIETMLDGPTPNAARELGMSFKTGPNEPTLRIARLELGMMNWAYLDPETREQVIRGIPAVWADYPEVLGEMAYFYLRTQDVREALSADPEAVAAFDSRIETLKSVPPVPPGDPTTGAPAQ